MREWRFSGIVVIVVLAVLGVARLVWGGGFRETRNLCDGLQLAVVCVVFAHAVRTDPRELGGNGWGEAERKHCRVCVDQFLLQWRVLWAGWIAYYAVHCSRHVVETWVLNPDTTPAWGICVTLVLDLMHGIQSVILVMLFWTMIRPTFIKGSRNPVYPVLLVGVIALVLLVPVDGFFLWFLGHAPGDAPGVPTAGLWAALFIGVAVATSFGLFVGRLESRYLDVSTLEIGLLCVYTVTQSLFRIMCWMEYAQWPAKPPYLVSLAQGADFGLKLLALALKLGLYAVVYRQIKSGRLAFYMLKVRVLEREIRKQWEAFESDRLAPPEERARESLAPEA